MVSTYVHDTALKVYATIAAAGANGVDFEQLRARLTSPHSEDGLMAGNTIRTYARWLQEDGAIDIQTTHSEANNRPLKNLYIAIREPRPRLTEADRLRLIAGILEPFSRHPKSWDKGHKSEIIYAIREAIRLTL